MSLAMNREHLIINRESRPFVGSESNWRGPDY